MNKKGRSLLKNVGILTVSNFASKILVFLLVPLYTSVLTTSEYGTYDLAMTTILLLFPIFTLNIIDALMRFMLDKNCDKKQVATIGLLFCLIGIALGALTLFVTKILNIYEAIQGLELFILFFYIFYVSNQYLIQFAKGLDRVFDMSIAGVIGTLVMLGSNVFFLLVIKSGLEGFFIANILCQAIPSLYLFIRLKIWQYINLKSKNEQLTKEMLFYSVPLIASAVGWWVNSGSDRYIVTFFCGITANGVLSVAYKIPTILNTFQGIFIQAWQIAAIKEYGEKDTAVFYGQTFFIINLLMCVACSLLIILTKPLAYLLYSNDFYQAWQYVPFLLVASVLNCASGLLGPILSAQKNTKAMMWSAIIGAGVNIILNIVLVYIIGIQGATIATVICSYIIYAVRKKAVGNDIKIEKYSIVVITWLLLCLQATVEINFVWYWELIIMVAMIMLNFNILKELVIVASKLFKSIKQVNE